jgi:hypothetical protein
MPERGMMPHVALVDLRSERLQFLLLMEAEGRKPSGRLALTYDRTACAVPL